MRCGVHLIHSYSAGLASRLASLAVTAADPSFPGAHSTISAAGSSVLFAFFGERAEIDVTSDALPGIVRAFTSYRAIATEAGPRPVLPRPPTPPARPAGGEPGPPR